MVHDNSPSNWDTIVFTIRITIWDTTVLLPWIGPWVTLETSYVSKANDFASSLLETRPHGKLINRKLQIKQKLYIWNEKTQTQRRGETELRLVYHTVFLKHIRHSPVLGFELASTSLDTSIFTCKAAPLYIFGELNVSSITLNLELRSSKKEWERKENETSLILKLENESLYKGLRKEFVSIIETPKLNFRVSIVRHET